MLKKLALVVLTSLSVAATANVASANQICRSVVVNHVSRTFCTAYASQRPLYARNHNEVMLVRKVVRVIVVAGYQFYRR